MPQPMRLEHALRRCISYPTLLVDEACVPASRLAADVHEAATGGGGQAGGCSAPVWVGGSTVIHGLAAFVARHECAPAPAPPGSSLCQARPSE